MPDQPAVPQPDQQPPPEPERPAPPAPEDGGSAEEQDDTDSGAISEWEIEAPIIDGEASAGPAPEEPSPEGQGNPPSE